MILVLSGCVERRSAEPANPPEASEIETALRSSTEFGFDMFKGLANHSPDENVVTSPYSAAVLLTMLLNGAGGETREAIGEVLHLRDPFDAAINEQHQDLMSYLIEADPDVEIAIANSLWANEGTPFEEQYIDSMREHFAATVEEVDLGSQSAADEIDQWVAEQTNDRIEEMAEDLGLPDPGVVLVLLNAVYFLGEWTDPFDPDLTHDDQFTRLDGSTVDVPFMQKDEMFLYIQTEEYESVRLTYGEEAKFGMDIFLPSEHINLNEFRETFDFEAWSQANEDYTEAHINLSMPTFELEYDTGDHLDKVLEELGMGIAYGSEADFSPMSPVNPWLSTVVQKTFIRVDEEGTEAAAATGAAMVESAPPQVRIDRPFLFTISDSETGSILFLGQVTDPSE
jgi:serine protease inhibitor